MTLEQTSVFALLAVTMVLFAWGRWRYDLVAVMALMVAVLLDLVPVDAAFTGFSHPAVITVAAVLIISKALQNSGLVEQLAKLLAPAQRTATLQVAAASGFAALCSAFMNNVGALALMLPVTLRNAYQAGRSSSLVLMPLAAATLLGGLITLIGTPPNIIIASFRGQATGTPFGMFDFTPVGLVVAIAGLAYLSLFGWRLLPSHRFGETHDEDIFQIEAYVTEAFVPAHSIFIDQQIRMIEELCENDVTVMAIIRDGQRSLAPATVERLADGDILILEGDPVALEPLIGTDKLMRRGSRDVQPEDLRSPDFGLMEAVVLPHSPIEGQSMRGLRMHDRYGINLLAMARKGEAPKTRLGRIRFKVGDVLLLQGERKTMQQVLQSIGCLPLADRGLKVAKPVVGQPNPLVAPAIFGAAILLAAFGILPVQIAFVLAVIFLVLSGCLSLREAYESVEWPVVLLLGALIPVGEAVQHSGGADLIAQGIIALTHDLPVWALLTLLLVVSMLLSDLIHNSPTAVLMAPIAISIAEGVQLPVEPFLMAVAVGSASPYLTPIGHQSNTLVMAPGGYRFFDYARMGVALEVIIVAVAVPMILWVWMP